MGETLDRVDDDAGAAPWVTRRRAEIGDEQIGDHLDQLVLQDVKLRTDRLGKRGSLEQHASVEESSSGHPASTWGPGASGHPTSGVT